MHVFLIARVHHQYSIALEIWT